MNLTQWPWKNLAIVAGVAGAVVAIGFLADTGPVQGTAAKATFYRTADDCLITIELGFGGSASDRAEWFFYGSETECLLERDSVDSNMVGRKPISESVKAVLKK